MPQHEKEWYKDQSKSDRVRFEEQKNQYDHEKAIQDAGVPEKRALRERKAPKPFP